jgi:TolA-binding protein
MKQLAVLLAVLSMLVFLPSCEKRFKEVQIESPNRDRESSRTTSTSRINESDEEILPPPEGETPKPKKNGKNDQTLVLLADIVKQQNNMQGHLSRMEEHNSKVLDALTTQASRVTAIESSIPKLSDKIDAQAQKTRELEERIKLTDDLVRGLQEQIRTKAEPVNARGPRTSPSKNPEPTPLEIKQPPVETAKPAHGQGENHGDTNDLSPDVEASPDKKVTEKFSPHALQLRAQVKATYRKVLVDFPQMEEAAKASYGLGVMAEEEENWPAAVDAYSFVVKNFPHHPLAIDAQYGLSRAKAKLGKWEDARKGYLDLADKNPKHGLYVPALLAAADCLVEQNKLNDAMREYRSIQRTNNGTSYARSAREKIANILVKLKRYPEAVAEYKLAMDGLSPSEKMPVELQMAIAQLKSGDTTGARTTLEGLRAKARQDDLGWNIRWNLARTYEEEENALDAARAYVELANDYSALPQAQEARLRAAHSYLVCGISGHAAEEARRALTKLQDADTETRNKYEPEALFTLAKAGVQTGDVDEVRRRLNELRKRYPAHELTQRCDVDEAEAMANAGKLEDAIGLLRQIILRKPNSPAATDALLRIAEYQERSGNARRGADVYSELTKFVDQDKQRSFRLQRGILLQSLGQHEQARDIFNGLIADTAAPQAISALAIYQTALIDQIEGKLAAAVAGYEKFIESGSGAPAVLGMDLTPQLENAKFKISKLKLINASQDQETADGSVKK